MSEAYVPMPRPPDLHDFDRIDEQPEGFVLRCRCGWLSAPSWSAAEVGNDWDQHRREAGARKPW